MTKIKQSIILCFCACTILLSSCGKDEPVTPATKSSQKAITSFTISSVAATINESAKTITIELPSETDVTSLSPVIAISSKATVSPASGSAQDFTSPVTYTVTAENESTAAYTVTVTLEAPITDHIYSFTYNGTDYEVVRVKKTWVEAAASAVERGGYLAEINDAAENTAIFNELLNNASITLTNTAAADGGNASYVWIGGNDISEEGTWVWNGNNDENTTQFWNGTASGNAVDGLYNNWGNEPDNYMEQDGLGIALTQWPLTSGTLGTAAQWNDIDASNELYYIIELN